MDFTHFMRIEREGPDGKPKHFVVHTHDPKLSIELAPDGSAADQVGQGVIKRVCVPNSWAGNYSQYGKLIAQAQAFFKASRAEPTLKSETRRFQT